VPNDLLNEAAATLNLKHYYLKFFLRGVREPLIYEVTKEEWEGVSHWFRHRDPLVLGSLLTFETATGRVVNVIPKYVALCQELWDVGIPIQKGKDPEESPYDLIMYVDGISEPLLNMEIDPDDVNMMTSILEAGGDEADEFVTFIDQDGERNWLMAGSIMLMDSIEYREEIEEETASSTKKEARRKARRASKP
jgi:hypothetical protein